MNKIDHTFNTNCRPIKSGTLATLSLFLSLLVFTSQAQVVEFSDDFESGTGNWTLTNNWGLNSTNFNSSTNSLTESPVGNYSDWETSYATMSNPVDLSAVLDANLSFWAIYDIEFGFDYMYVEASGDGGSNWINIASFDSVLVTWTQFSYSLGGLVGSANVLVRFRFVSDGAVNDDGMYIDDFEITSNNIDNSPPLILHTGPALQEASLADQNVTAQIIDISGISQAELSYTVDGGAPQIVTGVNITADDYLFVIPQQLAGAWVNYWITAIDASDSLNMAQSSTSSYISGNYIAYDNAQIDFVNSYGPGSPAGYPGAAVRITLAGTTDLVTSLIRNYTDNTRPNDSMLIHVWADGGGFPGADLITPFMLFPEATLAEPNKITRVDLRPFSSQLSNLSGDVFIGFTVPSGEVWVSQTTPGTAVRTFADTGSVWINITDDYHFRAITDTFAGAPVASFSFNSSGDPAVTFADSSANTPTSWFWDFGDGSGTDSIQNPGYTYTINGTYNVCLTVTNGIGTNTICQWVTIANVPTVANFSASDTNICVGDVVTFTDLSTPPSLSWLWMMPGAAPSSDTTQNPTVVYNTPGTYNVFLKITNIADSDSVTMNNYITVNSLPAKPTISVSGSLTLCPGDNVTLTSSSTTGNLWSNASTSQAISVSTSGDYTVMFTDSNGCSSATSDTTSVITVASPAIPTISTSDTTTFCEGGSVTLTSSSATGNTWTTGATTQSITVDSAGTFMVYATDSNGCTSNFSAITSVTVNPNPPVPSISQNVNVLSSDIAVSYQWFMNSTLLTGDTSQDYTITQDGIYTVEVTSANGCTAMSAPLNATYTGIEEMGSYINLQVYPNPSTGEFTLEMEVPERQDIQISITNIAGLLVHKETWSNISGNYKGILDLRNYTAGVYNLRLTTGKETFVKQIIID